MLMNVDAARRRILVSVSRQPTVNKAPAVRPSPPNSFPLLLTAAFSEADPAWYDVAPRCHSERSEESGAIA